MAGSQLCWSWLLLGLGLGLGLGLASASASAASAAQLPLNLTLTQETLDSIVRDGAGLDAALALWDARVLAAGWPLLEAAPLQPACRRGVAQLLAGLGAGRRWALRECTVTVRLCAVLDASGRYSRRLHSGNEFWLGSKDMCNKLNSRANNSSSDPDIPPLSLLFHIVKFNVSIEPLMLDTSVEAGLCLPGGCSARDSELLLTELGRVRARNLTVNSVRVLAGRYSFWRDPRFCALFVSTAGVTLLVIVATVYDFQLTRKIFSRVANDVCKSCDQEEYDEEYDDNNNNNDDISEDNNNTDDITKNNSDGIKVASNIKLKALNYKMNTNVSDEKYDMRCNERVSKKEDRIWKWREDAPDKVSTQILLSFSLRTNLQKLCSLSVGEDTLSPIHGLRVLSMMWIVLIHACLIFIQSSDNKQIRKEAEKNFLYQSLSSGTYSVDTFFLISGTLVSFLYFRTVSRHTTKELTFTKGYKAEIMKFLGMMIYRFIRLTPPYLYVIGIVSCSMKYIHEHTVIEFGSEDYRTCDKFWWRNLIYLNTFFSMDERCMVWSWYLANDTQFYTVGIFLLLLAVGYFKAAVVAVGLLFLSTWTTTAVITINTEHKPSIEDPFANYDDVYDKPWTRIGPYLTGMCAGWFLFRTQCRLHMHKGWVIFCWVLAISNMASIVYGVFLIEFGPVLSALYVSLSHTAWAVSVAWVIIACCTGNGGIIDKILSWPYLYPISRLSYCTYLIHPQVMRIIYYTYDSTFHVTIYMMTTIFAGLLVLSYIMALFITLTFEAPVVSLLRILHPMARKKAR